MKLEIEIATHPSEDGAYVVVITKEEGNQYYFHPIFAISETNL